MLCIIVFLVVVKNKLMICIKCMTEFINDNLICIIYETNFKTFEFIE